jgi:hypothetical protein
MKSKTKNVSNTIRKINRRNKLQVLKYKDYEEVAFTDPRHRPISFSQNSFS